MQDFSKKYNPKDFEQKLYQDWEQNGLFLPREGTTGEQFYIPVPPPNVTGVLHLGHALTLTLEDIMTRYHRMKGDKTLWLPGTDHAGISVQAKVEKKLHGEGKTKFDLTREEFLQEAYAWKDHHAGIIKEQFKKMGASLDWSREKFTMDQGLNEKVTQAFVKLYKKGLIYKGEYMVNYSPTLETVLSDQEVIYREEPGKMYHITYFVSGSDNEVIVATTRPETLLGDVAVMVHPKDKRYKKLIKGEKKLILPILNKEIPIITDESVDMEFGTGAVKITPAHDPNDFQAAKRHNLSLEEIVIDKKGNMTEKAGLFAGQHYLTARENVVELLKAKGNLIKIEDHTSRVGYSERSGEKVETIISTQWFVGVQPLVDKVVAGYKKKEFEIIPARFNKIFEDWIFNLRDWCISRQLIWGHQIPVWYDESGKEYCAETLAEAQKEAGEGVKLTQETDVLDTWFSSGLWPFSVLGYNMNGEDQPQDVKDFYPASVLETGHDIIFFWVIRMLLFGYEFTGSTPFEKIYLHGMVRDKQGRKMSKSLGNGVDPLDVIEEHGTDALRMTLAIGNTPGNDLKFDIENVEHNKFFVNKLWNVSRFVGMNLEGENSSLETIEKNLLDNYGDLMLHEKWILSRIRSVSDSVTEAMEKYNFSEAGEELQRFTKNEFADYYIEEFKLTKETSKYGKEVLAYTMNHLLRLWHPYIPFVTEEIYNKIGFGENLIITPWSKVAVEQNKEVEKAKNLIISIIKEIRHIRAENKVMPNKEIKVQIYALNKNAELLQESIEIIGGIVNSEETTIINKKPTGDNLSFGVIKAGVEVYIDTSNALDIEAETTRIKEQITDTKEYIAILDKKLLNEKFVKNAPETLVRAEMEKKEKAKDKLKKLEEKLGKLV